jgi:hypothetical protein
MEEVRDLRMDERQGAGGVLDSLMRKIPGYAGYRDRENRREADQRHREFVSKRLTQKKRDLQDVGEILLGSGDLSHMAPLDNLSNKIDRLIERTRHASSGFSSFVDSNVVDVQRLDVIYEHDLALLTAVEALDSLISTAEDAADGNDNVGKALRGVKKGLDEVDAHLDQRDKILKGLE